MAFAISGSTATDNGLAYKGIVTAIPTPNQLQSLLHTKRPRLDSTVLRTLILLL